MHYWVRASSSDFSGTLPQPRRYYLFLFSVNFNGYIIKFFFFLIDLPITSGHTAVGIGKSKVVIFGGLVEKRFLRDIVVYDIGISLPF